MTPDATVFTFRRARTPSLVVTIGVVLAIETAALHLLLVRHHPVVAWTITLSGIATFGWLLADYRRLGAGTARVDRDVLDLAVGLRFSTRIPRVAIATTILPTWRDIPAPAPAYLNAMKPAPPNVLLTLREPVPIRLLGVATRPVRQLGLCVDDPTGFVAALGTGAADA